jgi:carboxymethylenebutenolidase
VKASELAIPLAAEGTTQTYVALPPSGSGPGVLVITPIFGVTDGMKAFADQIAAQGFVVAVPDMFWRTLPGPLGYEGSDRDKAQARYKSFDVEQGVRDVTKLNAWLRSWPPVTGELGIVGVCFGGRYAFLAAARSEVDAAVSYHGTYIEKHLEECGRIDRNVSLHFGENDAHVPMSEVQRIRDAAHANPKIEIHTYAGAGHGFTQADRPSYQPQSAELAFARGIEVLRSTIGRRGKP